MDNKRSFKKLKWFVSYAEELYWLEEMALKGWKLKNIKLGILFYFEPCEPVRLLYEIDRFDLPQNPTLKDIRHKDIFIEVAQDMGWEVVAHDEGKNYYFCKPYLKGEINELYNDEESRNHRAMRYKELFRCKASVLLKILWFFSIIFFVLYLVEWVTGEIASEGGQIFVFIYIISILSLYFFMNYISEKYYLEFLRMKKTDDIAQKKIERKLIFTNNKLNKYLSEMARSGWMLEHMTAARFFFIREAAADYQYTMDSKYLTNKRSQALREDKLKTNNDWQLKSLKDAESKGWIFVCALEDRMVIYRNHLGERPRELNESKYNGRPRVVSLIGEYIIYLILCGLAGGVVGFGISYFLH